MLCLYVCVIIMITAILSLSQLAAAAEIDEEPVSKAKQSRSEKKARKVGVVCIFFFWFGGFGYIKLRFSSLILPGNVQTGSQTSDGGYQGYHSQV